jgi:protease-4
MPDNNTPWEREIVTQLAESSLKEQRRARRWGILFKVLTFAYIGTAIFMFGDADLSKVNLNEKHTALVELNGVIADNEKANADNIVTALRKAFDNENSAGVILRINSPGGSPVQSGYIYDEMIRLREKHPDTPLYAVVTDICASGGYYIAAAADKIYADKASIVGSIGVRMDSFGFVGSMEKLGVERRLYTAGENKGFLDPFTPAKESDVEHVEKLLENIHGQFQAAVMEGRGERLKAQSDLFSGLVWTGEESIPMGLADAVGSPGYVAREVIGEEEIVDFTVKPDLLERLSDRIGVAMAKGLGELFAGGVASPY